VWLGFTFIFLLLFTDKWPRFDFDHISICIAQISL
jgi:hypothetical protein